ncbi:MAG TPA: reverse transcriptase family protein [Pseudolabrys sp.]|uniref:reverse transcriptase family protein n=1 Tax=Pseudolabrys sp. TaxID=1960880 RepID=UPI002DDD04DB|nr:reverse transcriptase family protein [Pseudolabrys sp.]HEV2629016.1 reverse transcriptase family protein [Pseudolabrys sp.]
MLAIRGRLPADLARRLSTRNLSITIKDLEELSKDAGNFKLFTINAGTAKARAIQEPKPKLQILHRRVHNLLSRVSVPEYLHSAVAGKSYLSNAAKHSADVPVIKIDVKKFFASVPHAAILKFFELGMKCRRDVARILADLLTFDSHLPTGSSASPIIAYYAFKPMFDEIEALAKSLSLEMTCYVDDMALSGPAASKTVLHNVRKIIAKFGLKSHKAHAFAASAPKVITGVCITSDGNKVPNKLHLKIRKGFEAIAEATSSEAKQKASLPLIGRLEAAGQIDPLFKARAATLRATLRAERPVASVKQK